MPTGTQKANRGRGFAFRLWLSVYAPRYSGEMNTYLLNKSRCLHVS